MMMRGFLRQRKSTSRDECCATPTPETFDGGQEKVEGLEKTEDQSCDSNTMLEYLKRRESIERTQELRSLPNSLLLAQRKALDSYNFTILNLVIQ